MILRSITRESLKSANLDFRSSKKKYMGEKTHKLIGIGIILAIIPN